MRPVPTSSFRPNVVSLPTPRVGRPSDDRSEEKPLGNPSLGLPQGLKMSGPQGPFSVPRADRTRGKFAVSISSGNQVDLTA